MVVRGVILDDLDGHKFVVVLLETLHHLPERPLAQQVPDYVPVVRNKEASSGTARRCDRLQRTHSSQDRDLPSVPGATRLRLGLTGVQTEE